MEVHRIREHANALGIDCSIWASKSKLVRAIQHRQGHVVCFGEDERFACDERSCPWRIDCLVPIAEWRR